MGFKYCVWLKVLLLFFTSVFIQLYSCNNVCCVDSRHNIQKFGFDYDCVVCVLVYRDCNVSLIVWL